MASNDCDGGGTSGETESILDLLARLAKAMQRVCNVLLLQAVFRVPTLVGLL